SATIRRSPPARGSREAPARRPVRSARPLRKDLGRRSCGLPVDAPRARSARGNEREEVAVEPGELAAIGDLACSWPLLVHSDSGAGVNRQLGLFVGTGWSNSRRMVWLSALVLLLVGFGDGVGVRPLEIRLEGYLDAPAKKVRPIREVDVQIGDGPERKFAV